MSNGVGIITPRADWFLLDSAVFHNFNGPAIKLCSTCENVC